MRLSLAIGLVGAALLSVGAPAAQGDYRGRIEIRHSDDFAREHTHTSYRLVQGTHRIPLTLATAPRTPSGSRVIVHGRRVGSRIRGKVRASGRGIVQAAGVLAGPRKTAVILINFNSDTTTPWTTDVVRQRVFTAPNSTSAFYSEESYGDVSLTGNLRADGDVFGWYTIAATTVGCNVDLWAAQAQAAAAAHGFDASAYQHIIYAFPEQSSCGGWAGLGELPGQQSWINGDISTRVVAHELGHNMGLHHASSITCTSGGVTVAYSSSCTPDEYGDPFDVMGSNARHNNAWHLRQIGFLAGGNAKTVSTSGTYTLTSAIARGTTGQTQLLRVPIAGTSPQKYYDLEVRSSGGVFDNYGSTSPAVNGVTIHVDRTMSRPEQSLLIDATPGSFAGFSDAPLPAGGSFSDGTVSIGVSATSSGTATVNVLTGPDTTPPSAPASLTAQPGADRVTLGWPSSTDNVGVAGYRVYRDDSLRATTTSPGYTDTAVTPGSSYSYRVTAFDAGGNTASSASVVATVPTGAPAAASQPEPTHTTPSDPAPILTVDPPLSAADTVRPVVRILSPTRRARVRSAVVRARASDSSGVVRTQVWVDGVLRRTVDGTDVNWRWPLRTARRGRHLISVRAFDAAGNHGVASVRVRVVGRRAS